MTPRTSVRPCHAAPLLLLLLAAFFPGYGLVAAAGEAIPALPADVQADSRSRLPLLPRAALDDEGKRIWDALTRNGTVPLSAPGQVGIYTPKAAESTNALNQALRASVNGTRYFELAALVAAREFDQQYVWTQHECTALAAGLEQGVIDAVKFNRELTGLAERDATAIRLGRALFRAHRVSPELWAQTVQLFGQRGAAELVLTLGEYALTSVIVTAVDQQLPAGTEPALPPR